MSTKTGREIMTDMIAQQGMCRLVDLKVGDKFYGMDWNDENIYELMNLRIIHDDNSVVEYILRQVGCNHTTHHKMTGDGVVNRTTVVRYRGRNKGSFIAGFKAAMRIYQKHMQVFDKENAGLDNYFTAWRTMNDEYKNWKTK